MPLELLIAFEGILTAWVNEDAGTLHLPNQGVPLLPVWRELHGTGLEYWLKRNLQDYFKRVYKELQKPIFSEDPPFFIDEFHLDNGFALDTFFMASMQDTYQMRVNYEEGQIITFSDKNPEGDSQSYDLFPPMMFCNAATQLSRRYLCSESSRHRRCITADHPYAVWLLKNAAALNEYYARQFLQIVSALYNSGSVGIAITCNSVREQLLLLPEHHGVDIAACPQLSKADFWVPKDKPESSPD